MSPITNRDEAKEGGFAQVREALVAFEMDIIAQDARGNVTGFDQYAGGIGRDGQPLPPREYLQIVGTNVVATEVTEDLSMDISESWSIRIWCSDFKGSFWVESFLESSDRNQVLIPDGLVGKRMRFKKVLQKAYDRNGNPNPQFDATGFIIDAVIGTATATSAPVPAAEVVSDNTPASTPAPAPAQVVNNPASSQAAEAPTTPPQAGGEPEDPMEVAADVADGKTDNQFKTAIAMHPVFTNSPFLSLAKSGALTQTLINEGKLQLVTEGNKSVYRKVE